VEAAAGAPAAVRVAAVVGARRGPGAVSATLIACRPKNVSTRRHAQLVKRRRASASRSRPRPSTAGGPRTAHFRSASGRRSARAVPLVWWQTGSAAAPCRETGPRSSLTPLPPSGAPTSVRAAEPIIAWVTFRCQRHRHETRTSDWAAPPPRGSEASPASTVAPRMHRAVANGKSKTRHPVRQSKQVGQ
jgi:hypothetical protein